MRATLHSVVIVKGCVRGGKSASCIEEEISHWIVNYEAFSLEYLEGFIFIIESRKIVYGRFGKFLGADKLFLDIIKEGLIWSI
jgi:hypothetical protein